MPARKWRNLPGSSYQRLHRELTGLPLRPTAEQLRPQNLRQVYIKDVSASPELRQCIILGERPTYPYDIISIKVPGSPPIPAELVGHATVPTTTDPTAKLPSRGAQLVHWSLDPNLPDRLSVSSRRNFLFPAHSPEDGDPIAERVWTAFDVTRDSLISVVATEQDFQWRHFDGHGKRVLYFLYGPHSWYLHTGNREIRHFCFADLRAGADAFFKFAADDRLYLCFPFREPDTSIVKNQQPGKLQLRNFWDITLGQPTSPSSLRPTIYTFHVYYMAVNRLADEYPQFFKNRRPRISYESEILEFIPIPVSRRSLQIIKIAYAFHEEITRTLFTFFITIRPFELAKNVPLFTIDKMGAWQFPSARLLLKSLLTQDWSAWREKYGLDGDVQRYFCDNGHDCERNCEGLRGGETKVMKQWSGEARGSEGSIEMRENGICLRDWLFGIGDVVDGGDVVV